MTLKFATFAMLVGQDMLANVRVMGTSSHAWLFNMGIKDLNSGLHACIVISLMYRTLSLNRRCEFLNELKLESRGTVLGVYRTICKSPLLKMVISSKCRTMKDVCFLP